MIIESGRIRQAIGRSGIALAGLLVAGIALAHGVEERDAMFLERNAGQALLAFAYLGAKHMITGYDHLLYLFGVVFFLYRPKDIAVYVTLFAVGHSITLLGGVLADINVNVYLVDAVIGLSVAYKAFENLDGFRKFFNVSPNPKIAVFLFGLESASCSHWFFCLFLSMRYGRAGHSSARPAFSILS